MSEAPLAKVANLCLHCLYLPICFGLLSFLLCAVAVLQSCNVVLELSRFLRVELLSGLHVGRLLPSMRCGFLCGFGALAFLLRCRAVPRPVPVGRPMPALLSGG